MSRLTTTTAMAVSLTALCVFAVPAGAACVADGDTTNPVLTCTDADITPIDDARDNLSVIFESDRAACRDQWPAGKAGRIEPVPRQWRPDRKRGCG